MYTADHREFGKAVHGTRQLKHPYGLCGREISASCVLSVVSFQALHALFHACTLYPLTLSNFFWAEFC